MTTARPRPTKGTLDPEMRTLYTAVGQFNANVFAWYCQDPKKVEEITDWVVSLCPTHAAQCDALGPRYMWNQDEHSCVRIDGEVPDDPPVG